MDCTSKYSVNDIIKLIERNEKAKVRNKKNSDTFRSKMSDDEYKALKSSYNKAFRSKQKTKNNDDE